MAGNVWNKIRPCALEIDFWRKNCSISKSQREANDDIKEKMRANG